MLEFTQGDIFDAPADIRVNTVNCVGVMGAGVALAFKQRYPEMFKDYQRDCKDGQVRPGRMHVWKSLSGDWIVNFPTKRDWREPSRYEDIDAGLDDLRAYLDAVGPVTVALPALGCGHGGLDWTRVSEMICDKLTGVKAHVLVFAPTASRQAGRSAAVTPSDDERESAGKLGYRILERPSGWADDGIAPLYVLGDAERMARPWIALLPSRAPGEREKQALRAIAAELARSHVGPTVALVHGARASEEIAEMFAECGVGVVLLLPFGVLTRPAIGRHAGHAQNAVALVSAAPARVKWSRQLFAQAMDLLRSNAAAVLVSDPEPGWLAGKGFARWTPMAISYVRYEAMSAQLRQELSDAGAKPIGRRGDGQTPNIDHLLTALGSAAGERGRVAEAFEAENAPVTSEDEAAPCCPRAAETGRPVLTFIWDDVSRAARRALLDFLERRDASGIVISVELPSRMSQEDKSHLKALAQVQSGEER